MVKNLHAMKETQVPSLAWEDILEKGMTTYSSILAWRIPQMEEPDGSQPMGPWKQPLRKDLQEPLITQAGKWSSQEVEIGRAHV